MSKIKIEKFDKIRLVFVNISLPQPQQNLPKVAKNDKIDVRGLTVAITVKKAKQFLCNLRLISVHTKDFLT